jgi:hypothetical protein
VSDTRREAWQAIQGAAPRLRQMVYDHIASTGQHGCTSQEVETALKMAHETISPRVHELKSCGAIADSGKRRVTRSGRRATVYVIASLAQKATKQANLF